MAGVPTTLSGIVGFVIVTAFLFSLFPSAPSNQVVEQNIASISSSTDFIKTSTTVNSTETILGSHALAVAAGFFETIIGFVLFAVSDILLVFTLLGAWLEIVININPILSFVGTVLTILLVVEVAKRLLWGTH